MICLVADTVHGPSKCVPYCKMIDVYLKYDPGWWFGTFFIFPYVGNNHPNWLIFFRGVETTNQDPLVSPDHIFMDLPTKDREDGTFLVTSTIGGYYGGESLGSRWRGSRLTFQRMCSITSMKDSYLKYHGYHRWWYMIDYVGFVMMFDDLLWFMLEFMMIYVGFWWFMMIYDDMRWTMK